MALLSRVLDDDSDYGRTSAPTQHQIVIADHQNGLAGRASQAVIPSVTHTVVSDELFSQLTGPAPRGWRHALDNRSHDRPFPVSYTHLTLPTILRV